MFDSKVNNVGLIFNLQPKSLGLGHLGWAQGPQQILIGDRRRIYFSTRFSDLNGYVYSDVRFVDFDQTLTKTYSEVSAEVISRGLPGTFDEAGIFPFHPMNDTLNNQGYFQALTCGWQRKKSVDIDMKIGLVETFDKGVTFKRVFQGPIMSSTPEEPYLIGDASTIHFREKTMVYYIFGTGWTKDENTIPERQYKIGVSEFLPKESKIFGRTGISIIPNRITNEAQAMPSVIVFEGLLHMFYCYRSTFDFRENHKNSYKLAHSFSHDGLNWTNTNASFLKSTSNWDSQMQCYPSAFVHENFIYLLYNGNSFGKLGFGCTKINGRWLNEYSRLQS